jgi:hypothetical protein
MRVVCAVCISHVICCTWFVLACVLCEGQTAAVMKSVNPLPPNAIYMSYRTANLQMLHFKYLFNKCLYWIFQTCCVISVFLSSKCRLFHNATFFGSCIIHILNTGVLKFKRKFRRQRVKCRHRKKTPLLPAPIRIKVSKAVTLGQLTVLFQLPRGVVDNASCVQSSLVTGK